VVPHSDDWHGPGYTYVSGTGTGDRGRWERCPYVTVLSGDDMRVAPEPRPKNRHERRAEARRRRPG